VDEISGILGSGTPRYLLKVAWGLEHARGFYDGNRGAERDQQNNWACRKTKIGFDAGFDFEIFVENQFVNNKSGRYLCKVYYRCTFKYDFDIILYEYLCSFQIVLSRQNYGIVSIFWETITAGFWVW
jgi:hypothetical protein